MTILEERADMASIDLQCTWSITLQHLFADLIGNVILGYKLFVHICSRKSYF